MTPHTIYLQADTKVFQGGSFAPTIDMMNQAQALIDPPSEQVSLDLVWENPNHHLLTVQGEVHSVSLVIYIEYITVQNINI